MIRHGLAIVLFGTGLLAACTPQSAPVSISSPPPVPAPLSETVPKPPVTADALIWQPGYWDWNGSAYTWQPGQYVPAAGHGNLWMPGYWAQTPAGWAWQPPHWTS